MKPGNAMPLGNMPVGTIVHNVELKIGKGGQIARSAGTYAQIVGRDRGYVILRLNSGEQRLVHGRCMATVGAVSNPDNMNTSIGKAGRKRWMGRVPHNRGVTMNPVDHPHGGGEGRTSGGRHPVTPVGQADQGQEDPQEQVDRRSSSCVSRHARKKKRKGRRMARSVWKGPFVDGYLLKKADAARASGRHEMIKIWSRRSTILPQFVGLTFGVYNGQKHIPVMVTEEMVGHKFGEFSPTRTFYGHSGRKPSAHQSAALSGDGQGPWASAHATRSRHRGQGGRPHAAGQSPQKLNLVAQLIRGKKVATALADLEFSQQAHRQGGEEVPGVGDRQRREQSRPRRRRSGRRRGACRQGAGA